MGTIVKHMTKSIFTLLATIFALSSAESQTYPNRPVTLVVGYAAGGALDQSGRLIGQALATKWGQSVVVDNKAGANGTIGAAVVANAKPDGYTLLVTTTSHTLNKFVVKGLRYDPVKSFAPVALTVEVPNVLVVNASSPYHTTQQLVSAMRSKSKNFSYASQGVGGIPHLAGEIFKLRTQTDMVHVPYRGAAQGMVDLIAGNVDMSFPSPGSVLSHIQAGKLRALAVAADTRFTQLKDVPTFAEAGIANFSISTWHGVVAPAGTPAVIIAKLNADINEIIQTPEFKAALASQGNSPASPISPTQFGAKLEKESKDFEAVASRIDLN